MHYINDPPNVNNGEKERLMVVYRMACSHLVGTAAASHPGEPLPPKE
jgi:hypothetical protein